MKKSPRLFIAGGGSGGHVLPALSIAKAFTDRFPEGKIFMIGTQGGLEEKLVPAKGYPLILLKTGSLNRVSFKKRLKTLLRLPFNFWVSLKMILKHRPDAVLGVGGYASGSLCLMAIFAKKVLRIPIRMGLLEQNAVLGFTNRILLPYVQRLFCAFPLKLKPNLQKKVLMTGNPIRHEFTHLKAPLKEPFTLLIFGGSQGSVGINSKIIEALPFLEKDPELFFIHQTGPQDFQRVQAAYQKTQCKFRVEAFIHNMAQAYEQASLLICRSGSTTLSEIAMAKRAAILIPLPTAADDHQLENARHWEAHNAATLLEQNKIDGPTLAQKILELKAHPEIIDQQQKMAQSFQKPDAAQEILKGLFGD